MILNTEQQLLKVILTALGEVSKRHAEQPAVVVVDATSERGKYGCAAWFGTIDEFEQLVMNVMDNSNDKVEMMEIIEVVRSEHKNSPSATIVY